jgi:tetrapyrrole methylase family protein/MazG family protein
LAEAVAHLRAPDGCPWDLAQTHDSLRPYLLEEAHEALAALDAEDMPALAEELGDLLLQIVLHAQIAVEEGDFSLSDVIRHITEKIWRRHPHVFGDVRADTVDEVLTNWEALKRAERASKGSADAADPFTGIPVSLPALARAQAVQDRALRLEKLAGSAVGATAADPIEGLQAALQALNAAPADADVRAARLGDALWQLVALARAWELDAETALREHTGAVVAARPSEPGGIA